MTPSTTPASYAFGSISAAVPSGCNNQRRNVSSHEPALPWEIIEHIVVGFCDEARWCGVLKHVCWRLNKLISTLEVEKATVAPDASLLTTTAVAAASPPSTVTSTYLHQLRPSSAREYWLKEAEGLESARASSAVGVTAELRGSDMVSSLPLLTWARANGCPWVEHLCTAAAGLPGGLAALQYLRSTGCPWDASASEAAAETGDIETLRWAVENGADHDPIVLVDTAASAGRLDVLEWLIDTRGFTCDSGTAAAASEEGHLDVLQFLVGRGCCLNELSCEYAARAGHLHVLKWLKDNDCPWNADSASAAAREGHTEVLEWLFANSCPCDRGVWDAAAAEGHLPILRWARRRGIPDGRTVYQAAAAGGHLPVLKWCMSTSRGVPRWGTETSWAAACSGSLETLTWVLSMGCPSNAREMFSAAEDGEHAHVMQWLGDHFNLS